MSSEATSGRCRPATARRSQRRLWQSGVLGILVAVALGSGVSSQAPQNLEAGAILFTAQRLAADTSDPTCGTVPTYAASDTVAVSNPSAEAPLARSLVAAACQTFFEYEAWRPFRFADDASLHFFLGCRLAQVDGGVPGVVGTTGVTLYKNDEALGGTLFDDRAFGNCDPASPIEHTIPAIPTASTAFDVGDRLTVGLYVFMGPSDPDLLDSLFLLVANPATPTALLAPGLPAGVLVEPAAEPTAGPPPPPPPGPSPQSGEALSVSASPDHVSMAAGERRTMEVNVTNHRSYSMNVSFGVVDAPEFLATSWDPVNATVAPGGWSVSNVTIQASREAPPSLSRFRVAASDGRTANASALVSVQVQPASATPSPSANGTGSSDGDGATPTSAVEAGGALSVGDTPGPGLLASLLAAGGALVRFRARAP